MHDPGRRGAQVVCVSVSGRPRIEASGKLDNDGMTPRERTWGRADTNPERAKQTAIPVVRMLLAMSCSARCKYEVNEQVKPVKLTDDHKCKKRQVHLLSASVWGPLRRILALSHEKATPRCNFACGGIFTKFDASSTPSPQSAKGGGHREPAIYNTLALFSFDLCRLRLLSSSPSSNMEKEYSPEPGWDTKMAADIDALAEGMERFKDAQANQYWETQGEGVAVSTAYQEIPAGA
ncbi:predicted protein, partial [Postia placenta Mad-698-R]